MSPNNTNTHTMTGDENDDGIVIIDANSFDTEDDDDPAHISNNRNTGMDDSEREVWEFMTPLPWHNSIADKDSIFRPTYQATIDTLRKTAEEGGYDVIVEVGCGTGDIIGEMNQQKILRTSITNFLKDLESNTPLNSEQMVTIPCIGVDINKEVIDFCIQQHPHESCEFVVADALQLQAWWIEQGHDQTYHKPLVICHKSQYSEYC